MDFQKNHYLLQNIDADDDWVESVKCALRDDKFGAIDVARAIDDEGFDWDEDPFDDLIVDLARFAVKKGSLADVKYFVDERDALERWSDCLVCDSIDNPDQRVAVYVSRKLPLHILRNPRPCAEKTRFGGSTFVHMAARHGNRALIEKLVDEDGACPCRMTRYGTTPIAWAVENGHLPVVELLYDMMRGRGWTDGDIQRRSETNPPMPLLAMAMMNGRHDVVRFLLSKNVLGPSLFWTTPKCLRSLKSSGFTLPQLACALGNEECLQWYVEDSPWKLDVNTPSKKQGSLLHYACRRLYGSSDDKMSIVQYLVDMGASVTSVDGGSRTPMEIARMFHLHEVVRFFQEMDAERINNLSKTLLEMDLAQGGAKVTTTSSSKKKHKKKKQKKKKKVPALGAASRTSTDDIIPECEAVAPSDDDDDDDHDYDHDDEPTTAGTSRTRSELGTAEPPLELCCPITLNLFEDPVAAPDGQTYERAAIEAWLDRKGTSPMSGLAMSKAMLVPCLLVRRIVQDFKHGILFEE